TIGGTSKHFKRHDRIPLNRRPTVNVVGTYREHAHIVRRAAHSVRVDGVSDPPRSDRVKIRLQLILPLHRTTRRIRRHLSHKTIPFPTLKTPHLAGPKTNTKKETSRRRPKRGNPKRLPTKTTRNKHRTKRLLVIRRTAPTITSHTSRI